MHPGLKVGMSDFRSKTVLRNFIVLGLTLLSISVFVTVVTSSLRFDALMHYILCPITSSSPLELDGMFL